MHASIDHRIAAIAASQYGLITRDQLRALGLSRRAIEHRVSIGYLHRRHRGVFTVGHIALDWIGQSLAAVLAIGGDASVDLRVAARFYDSARPSWMRAGVPIPIVTTRRVRIKDPRIKVKTTRSLPECDRTVINGVPVVTSARLLVDLAARETRTVMCKLVDELAYHHHLDLNAVRACAERLRNCGHRGVARLEDALASYELGNHGTDSELEEMGQRWVDQLNVPAPMNNYYVDLPDDRPRLDMVYPDLLIAIEFDDIGHGRPTRRRLDQRRRRLLRENGWTLFVMTRERLIDPEQAAHWGRRLDQ